MAGWGAGAQEESLKDRNDKLCRERFGAGAEVRVFVCVRVPVLVVAAVKMAMATRRLGTGLFI